MPDSASLLSGACYKNALATFAERTAVVPLSDNIFPEHVSKTEKSSFPLWTSACNPVVQKQQQSGTSISAEECSCHQISSEAYAP